MLKFPRFIQMFEADLSNGGSGDPAPTPATGSTGTQGGGPASTPIGKTFSEDYVATLREESKNHRLAKKATEAKLRNILGLKEEDELSDATIAAFQTKRQQELDQAVLKANARLLKAEIKSLEGYDAKLVERLLDRSKVKIDDDGEVTGLKEALVELEKEFPQIKLQPNNGGPANPPPAGTVDEITQLETQWQEATKNGQLAEAVALKNKIFELRSKK